MFSVSLTTTTTTASFFLLLIIILIIRKVSGHGVGVGVGLHCKYAAMGISSMQICDGDETAAAVSLALLVTPVIMTVLEPLSEIATTFAQSKEDRRVSAFCTILYSLLRFGAFY